MGARPRDMVLVRGRPQLRQRPPPRHRRRAALGRGRRRGWAESLSWLGDESGSRQMLRLTGHRPQPHRAAPGMGDEQPLDAAALVEAELAAFAVTHDPEHGARAQTGVPLVPGAQPAQAPSTTSRPEAAATDWATTRSTRTKGPSRRSRSTMPSSRSMPPGPVVVRHRAAATALEA